MGFKLIIAVSVVAAMPVCVQAQAPSAPKPTRPTKAAPVAPVTPADTAQRVVKIISGDKVKTQTYCDIGKLSSQIEDAEQKKDLNKIDELNKKMDELATKLGTEYVALMTRIEDMDPNSKEALEVGSALATLDKLCAK